MNATVAHNEQNASYAEETCILETSKLTNDVSKYYHFRSLFLNISNVVCFMVSKKTLCHSICLQQLQLISKIHSVRILLSLTCEYEKSIEILFVWVISWRDVRFVEFYIVPTHLNNSRLGAASLCSFSFLQRAQRRNNKYQFYSPGLELTIYHNRYEHVNHYTIGVFCFVFIDFMYYSSK
jgi:hypothetical protein